MKHIPFQSHYRENFEVVEERCGHLTLFPHTDQLPLLLRALNLEFSVGLPDRIARVDKRADGLHKIMRYHAALAYCASLNAARPDQLRLFQLFDAHVVSHVSIVQQITENHPLGRVHRFRFYAGPDHFPEIRISGKRVAFADHVLQRFATRVTDAVGKDLTQLLLGFFGSHIIGLTVGKSPAFVLPWSNSLVAFTYKETAEEYFLTTCLTVNEINSLEKCHPALGHTPHYGPDFVRPRVRTWNPTRIMDLLYDRWHQRIPLPSPSPPLPECIVKSLKNWHQRAHRTRDFVIADGHGPGSQLLFHDQTPGPCVLELHPGQPLPAFAEI